MNNKKYFYCEDKGLWDEATEKNCHLWHEDRLHTHTSVFSAIIELKWENSRLISDYVHEGLIPSYASSLVFREYSSIMRKKYYNENLSQEDFTSIDQQIFESEKVSGLIDGLWFQYLGEILTTRAKRLLNEFK